MNLEPFKNCIAFKKAIHITNNTSAPYGPCCWYGSHVSANSWEEYQRKISQQDVEKNCKHCIDQEAAGITSHRSNFVDEDELVIGVFFESGQGEGGLCPWTVGQLQEGAEIGVGMVFYKLIADPSQRRDLSLA